MSDFHVQWHITNRCPLRCAHCYQTSFTAEHDLPLDKLIVIGDNLSRALRAWNRQGTVTVTGGEPLLKEELFPLLRSLDDRAEIRSLAVITSGILYNERIADELHAVRKLDEVLVSLDGATESVNQQVRGPSVFERVVRNLRMIKGEGFKTILMFTLLRRNMHELPQILDMPGWLDLDGIMFERFIPLGMGGEIAQDVLGPDDLHAAYRYIFDWIGEEYNEEDLLGCRALRIDFDRKKGETLLSAASCVAGQDGLAFLPDGAVLPCRRFPLPLGNLLCDSLADLWANSEVLRNVRDGSRLGGKCRACPVSGCVGCRAVAYAATGDYLAEDPQCWR